MPTKPANYNPDDIAGASNKSDYDDDRPVYKMAEIANLVVTVTGIERIVPGNGTYPDGTPKRDSLIMRGCLADDATQDEFLFWASGRLEPVLRKFFETEKNATITGVFMLDPIIDGEKWAGWQFLSRARADGAAKATRSPLDKVGSGKSAALAGNAS